MLYISKGAPTNRESLGAHALLTSALLQVETVAPHSVARIDEYLAFFSSLSIVLGMKLPQTSGWAC